MHTYNPAFDASSSLTIVAWNRSRCTMIVFGSVYNNDRVGALCVHVGSITVMVNACALGSDDPDAAQS